MFYPIGCRKKVFRYFLLFLVDDGLYGIIIGIGNQDRLGVETNRFKIFCEQLLSLAYRIFMFFNDIVTIILDTCGTKKTTALELVLFNLVHIKAILAIFQENISL